MTSKKWTRDEFFLIKLYEEASKLGDETHVVDRYVVGKAIGQNDKSVDNMVRMLAQANFIKKDEGTFIYLTASGIALVKELTC